MWKKILIGLVGLIVVILSLVMYGTSGMTETAEDFFKSAAAKQYDKAYSYLSDDFKQTVSSKELAAYMQRTGLENYRDVSWGNRSFEGKRGEIEGTVETASGGAIPITVKFVKKNDGSWRIYAINKPASGIEEESTTSSTAKAQLPSEAVSVKLAQESMLHFAEAIKQKDMHPLYTYASAAFQKELSVEKLNSAFKSFMDADIDLVAALDGMKPLLDPQPRIKEDGILLLEGYYQTTPNKVYFTFGYMQEKQAWKLVRINVKIK